MSFRPECSEAEKTDKGWSLVNSILRLVLSEFQVSRKIEYLKGAKLVTSLKTASEQSEAVFLLATLINLMTNVIPSPQLTDS